MLSGTSDTRYSGRMIVVRAGYAPMKGTRHLALETVTLDQRGPIGDRSWCLVDTERRRVLRTAAHPLLAATVSDEGNTVIVTLPDGRHASEDVSRPGASHVVDYWGRAAEVSSYDGGVGELLSSSVGRPVQLARASRGHVVYGAPVSLIGTASVDDLAHRMGLPDATGLAERFRSTFVVETEEPWVEDGWLGRELSIGTAVIRVHSPIGRCGVVNLNPTTGRRDAGVLKALASFRPTNAAREPLAAVDAEVVRPGVVGVGAQVSFVEPP